MTTPAANPLRLQVIDRIAAVLQAITAGANYWFAPGMTVQKKLLAIEDCSGYPAYMVFPIPGGPIEESGYERFDEDIAVLIKGYIKDEAAPVTMLEKCLRDVRRAINEDRKSGVAGSLGVIASRLTFEESPEVEFTIDGFGCFDQVVHVKIIGDFGVL